MIYELERTDFHKARPIFEELAAWQPFCAAVLSGIHPGRVLVDNLDSPTAGFLSHGDPWCFLAGDPGAGTFNEDLSRSILSRQAVPVDARSLLFTCHPADWGSQLPVVFGGRVPVPMARRHYACHGLRYDWRTTLPSEASVRPMDQALLRDRELHIPDDVTATIRKWRSLAAPDFQDFGLVAIARGEVASWATMDAVVNGVGDVGFFTQPHHRRRGLATAVTAAVIEEGFRRGMSAVHWTCAENNAGSIRIAEKLGLQRQADYTMYCFSFDEAEHLCLLGYHHLSLGQHREAAEFLEEAFALPEPPPVWAHYDAARAWAVLGEGARAFEHLNAAVDAGWSEIEGAEEFEILHGDPAWTALMHRIREQNG